MKSERKFGFVESLIIGLIGFLIIQVVTLTACSSETKNANAVEAVSNTTTDGVNYIFLDNNFYYDERTCIVYTKHYFYQSGVIYLPYYASNGKPYYYNKETNKLEMISDSSKCGVCNNGNTE